MIELENRIFRIDRDCYLIFVSDISTRDEKFLRIGNSDVIHTLSNKLTFSKVVTPLLSGNSDCELNLLKAQFDKKIIGLKNDVKNYLKYFSNKGVDTKNLKIVFADQVKENKGKTELEVINEIKENKNKEKHAYASFYNDGNVKIFNKDGIFFNLSEDLKNNLSIYTEIDTIYNHYKDFYNYADREGFVVSNNSIFFFSNNNFSVYNAGSNFVLDACLVGINPYLINIVFFATEKLPDNGYYEVFFKYFHNGKKVKVISNYTDNYINDYLYLINPKKHTFEGNFGNAKFFCQNSRVRINFSNIKLYIDSNDFYVNKAQSFDFSLNGHPFTNKFKFILDSYTLDKFTVFSYSPFYTDQKIEILNSVKDNMKYFDFDELTYLSDYIKDDNDYPQTFNFPLESRDSIQLNILAESIRRVVGENNIENPNVFIMLNNILNEIDVKYYFKKSFFIKQNLHINRNIPKVKVNFEKKSGFYINHNPYNMLINRDSFVDYNKIVNLINENSHYYERANQGLEESKKYIEEIERLNNFLKELEETDKVMEEYGLNGNEPYSTLNTIFSSKIEEESKNIENNNENIEEDSINGDNYNASELFETKIDNKKDFFKFFRKVFLFFLLLLILSGLSYWIYYLVKEKNIISYLKGKVKNDLVEYSKPKDLKKSQNTNKGDKIDRIIKDNIIKTDKIKVKKSNYYKFFMTKRDLLNLTNKIALLNGYRRILFDFELQYTGGKSPDWIYPGNIIILPGGKRIVVKSGDTLWNICETFLIEKINEDEKEIKDIIEKTNKNEIPIDEAKIKLEILSSKSESEMVRSLSKLLTLQDSFEEWTLVE